VAGWVNYLENKMPGEYISDKNKERLTFREIVLKAIENCRIEGSKHMVKGGEVTVLVNNQPMRITKEDQRKVFSETVKTLYDLLEYYLNKKERKGLKGDIKDIETLKRKKYDKLLNNYILFETNIKLKKVAEQGFFPKCELTEFYKQEYEDYKVELTRKEFRILIKLFKDEDELKQISYSESEDFEED